MRAPKLEVSGGALLAAAIFLYLDKDGIVLWLFLACALHELGHCLAIRALGGKIRKMRITCGGAELCLAASWQPSAKSLAVAALAGPGVNLRLGMGSALLARKGLGTRLYFVGALNFGLAIFNLLPARWLDGGKALESLLLVLGKNNWEAERFLKICSFAVTAFLLIMGGFLSWQSAGRNFTLLIAGFWMMGTTVTGSGKKRGKNEISTCF